jgi:hypothetical protein
MSQLRCAESRTAGRSSAKMARSPHAATQPRAPGPLPRPLGLGVSGNRFVLATFLSAVAMTRKGRSDGRVCGSSSIPGSSEGGRARPCLPPRLDVEQNRASLVQHLNMSLSWSVRFSRALSGYQPSPVTYLFFGEERGAPQEIEVELTDNSRKRAQAFSVAAALAETPPQVKWFLRRYLRSRLLTNDEDNDETDPTTIRQRTPRVFYPDIDGDGFGAGDGELYVPGSQPQDGAAVWGQCPRIITQPKRRLYSHRVGRLGGRSEAILAASRVWLAMSYRKFLLRGTRGEGARRWINGTRPASGINRLGVESATSTPDSP